MRLIRVMLAAALACGVLVGSSARAWGAEDPSVTLTATPTRVTFGKTVTLKGAISPAAQGEQVEIVDGAGSVRATATTAADGSFATSFAPRRNVKLSATWAEAASAPVGIGVKPLLSVAIHRVRLFDRAAVRGRVRPALPGTRVTVTLRRAGRIVARKRVALSNGRRYRARFRIRKPGVHRATARVSPPRNLRAASRTRRATTPLPSLSVGSKNVFVRLLERRLINLGYYLPRANKSFDRKTRDAMIAFNKVQRRARVGSVGEATWRRLASPIRPKPRFASGSHIEIDQTRQVIFVVRRGAVRWILHTSTGRNGYTRDGSFTVHRKLAGYSPGRLYYPSYFDGLRAIHGWREVPTYPASAGCARIPMWSARWMYGKVPMGSRIRIYH